ncbi:MAG TPA: hypothetical protein VGO39_02205 [Gaiellaceae bacterium]|nr:hypothetical protein [Gaiellaceae bacterium]
MRDGRLGRLVQAAPVGAVAGLSCWEAWHDSGSIAAASAHGFLPYAVLATLLLAVVGWSGAGARPTGFGVAAVALLSVLAGWAAISISWAAAPSLARDEALLTAFYAVALALPLVSLRDAGARLAALGLVTTILAVFGALAALKLGLAAHADKLVAGGRPYFPITYANAQGAQSALGFWPAVLFASRRAASVTARALALGAATLFLSATTFAQSKGTALGLLVSAIVVLAWSSARLRLLVVLVLCVAIDAVAFRPVTEPYRHATVHTVHTAGLTIVIAGVVGVIVGVAYATLDRRIVLSANGRRLAGRIAGGLSTAAILTGAVGFVAAEPHPVAFVQGEWSSFKHLDANAGGATHLTAIGSNRYDFWRVSLIEFGRHPINGCGARCFGPAYLVLGRSTETPARAHSLPLEVLGEQGLVGFALLMGALGLVLTVLIRGARRTVLPATAAAGAFVCWLVQACVDWTWTFPAVTVPAFLIAGIGAAAAAQHALARPLPAAVPVVCVVLALLVFAPPWYAQRLTDEALAGRSSNPERSLRWARRLDHVSTAPLIAEAALARNVTDELRSLRAAANREPRVLRTQYFLGSALLNAGRKAEARQVLRRANALDPGNPAVERALRLSG